MKTRLGFILFLSLVIIGITDCEKPDPEKVMLEIQGDITFRFSGHTNNDPLDTTHNNLPFYLNPFLTYGSITDIEGNIYNTIQIGTQIWMAENLRVTRYNDGSQITNVHWYNNNIYYKDTYGALYDHYIVNSGRLCPTGWHVPTDEEWKLLEMSLGMTRASADTSYGDFDVFGSGERGTDQGKQMKATTGWIAWEGKLAKGTNTSGFSALPAGDYGGWGGLQYECAGVCTTFWCSGDLWARTLSTTDSKVGRAIYFGNNCFSVRCIKN